MSLGQINLPFSLGEDPPRRTRTTIFTVVMSSWGGRDELIKGYGINIPSEGQVPSWQMSRRGIRKSSHHEEVLYRDGLY